MKLTASDIKFAHMAINSGKATDDEISFLDTMISLHAANEKITKSEYDQLQRLTGGHLSTTTPICERK